ncbi:hypothetical protein Leryth_011159 [Lithospermum erythrorhizon]|nr:hypothetical protein Leryth_011159 [Lithospermum erythrorhizon]
MYLFQCPALGFSAKLIDSVNEASWSFPRYVISITLSTYPKNSRALPTGEHANGSNQTVDMSNVSKLIVYRTLTMTDNRAPLRSLGAISAINTVLSNISTLTPFRPMKSAIGPLVIAPIIAPKVSMEPNNEYCKKVYRR